MKLNSLFARSQCHDNDVYRGDAQCEEQTGDTEMMNGREQNIDAGAGEQSSVEGYLTVDAATTMYSANRPIDFWSDAQQPHYSSQVFITKAWVDRKMFESAGFKRHSFVTGIISFGARRPELPRDGVVDPKNVLYVHFPRARILTEAEVAEAIK
jgi:hypothetical protein